MFKPLWILFIMKLHAQGRIFTKIICIWKRLFLEDAMFSYNFVRTVKNLYLNLEKPPLPSKIPAYMPGYAFSGGTLIGKWKQNFLGPLYIYLNTCHRKEYLK